MLKGVRAIKEVNKRIEVKIRRRKPKEIFVDKANADLLGGTESAFKALKMKT